MITSPPPRGNGVVSSAAGLVPFGHLGWGFQDRAEFLARAAEYIADGIAQGQWIEYVGAGSREELLAELAGMPGVADRLPDGRIAVRSPRDFYAMRPGSDVVDPETAVATRVAAVEKAIEDGYSGFRAVADVTAVTRTPEGREAFARFEFLIDRVMAVQPVSALCAYDMSQLGRFRLFRGSEPRDGVIHGMIRRCVIPSCTSTCWAWLRRGRSRRWSCPWPMNGSMCG